MMTGFANRTRAVLGVAAALLLVWVGTGPAIAQGSFQMNPPGELKLNYGTGVRDTRLFAPTMRFPIAKGHPATATSQVASPGGFHDYKVQGKWGDQCDDANFNERWWDTLCETRGAKGWSKVPHGCSKRTVHQGIDINGGTAVQCQQMRRAKSRGQRARLVPVVAVADGKIYATGYSYMVVLKLDDGSKFRYLHLDMIDAKARWPRPGMKVKAGELIGYLWNDFGRSSTTFHLHLEHWKSIKGVGYRPVPLYCDLARAYEADHGKTVVATQGLQCARRDGDGEDGGSIVTRPEPIPDTGSLAQVVSYWAGDDQRGGTNDGANNVEHGLVAGADGKRELVVTQAGVDPARGFVRGALVFAGKKTGDGYHGTLRRFYKGCAAQLIAVNGKVTNGDRTVTLIGDAPVLDASCQPTGRNERLRVAFSFLRFKSEAPPTAVCGLLKPAENKSETTYNWGAITMYHPPENWLNYIRTWPGLRETIDGYPADMAIDKKGGYIPAFTTPEAGVAIWYYWLMVRKGLGDRDGSPVRTTSIHTISQGIAGDGARPDILQTYIDEYRALSEHYFSARLNVRETIDITRPDVLWQLAQTMFHHEGGRAPIIDRATFDRGVKFGRDVIVAANKRADENGDDINRIRLSGLVSPGDYSCQTDDDGGSPVGSEADPAVLKVWISRLARERRLLCDKYKGEEDADCTALLGAPPAGSGKGATPSSPKSGNDAEMRSAVDEINRKLDRLIGLYQD